MTTKKRYRSEAERALWLGMIESGSSPACDLSEVGVRPGRREWPFVLVVGVALMLVASLALIQ